MAMIAETGRLASLDVVELNPTLDKQRATARISVDLIATLLDCNPPLNSRV
jgi:arginase